jgi:hypothetical protein
VTWIVVPSSARSVKPLAVDPVSVPATAIVPAGAVTGPVLCLMLVAMIVPGDVAGVPDTSTLSPGYGVGPSTTVL